MRSRLGLGALALTAGAAALITMLPAARAQTTTFSADEKSIVFKNIQAQVTALRSTPTEGHLRGTYSTKHLFETYSAGVEHVQGMAQLSDGRYALSHNARAGRRSLIVVSDGEGDTNMINVGIGNHPGAIQAAGKVIVVPAYGNSLTGSEIVFVDARDKNSPIWASLHHLRITQTDEEFGSAGIVFDPNRNVHWVIAPTSARSAILYKSNGKSLFDVRCKFESQGKFTGVRVSQGGTQLLIDDKGDMFVVALDRSDSGVESVALSQLSNPGPDVSATLLIEKELSDSGIETDYSAGFRWGGTVAKKPSLPIPGQPAQDPVLQVIGVSRTLTYGPAQNYAKLRYWNQ
jgi:hypothetical protein